MDVCSKSGCDLQLHRTSVLQRHSFSKKDVRSVDSKSFCLKSVESSHIFVGAWLFIFFYITMVAFVVVVVYVLHYMLHFFTVCMKAIDFVNINAKKKLLHEIVC